MTFKDKNILVVGLARSGVGAVNLLTVLGADVSVTDRQSRDSLKEYIEQLPLSAKVITGGNPAEVFNSADMIVISPGVPLSIPQLVDAKKKGIPVIGELELAYQTVMSSEFRVKGVETAHYSLPAFIGITGTNGKSTTTTLIDLMLKESGSKTLIGGNIGNALTKELFSCFTAHGMKSMDIDYIVAEISSFQLETIEEFKPRIAIILNITPDHLDRYDGMEDYISAKARIFENQVDGDSLVLNADDPVIQKIYNSKFSIKGPGLPDVFFFSREKKVEGVYCKDSIMYCNLPHLSALASDIPIISVDEIKIEGIHNLENAMAASLTAIISGASLRSVRTILENFRGLEHRLEYVGEIGGVKYINDSKGTNAGAVAKSLESFNHVILIMGGTDKNSDFSVLQGLMESKVKLLILIGEAKDKIAGSVGKAVETHKVNGLEEAVEFAMSEAVSGDVVMLSPGCASFDMFVDFEDRGRSFKKAVREKLK